MFDFYEKRKIRRVVYSRFFIGGVFLLTLLIGVSVYERFSIEREMADKLEERAEELEALKVRATLLETKVDHLKNERGIEEELRTRFDVAREGEQVIIIVDEDDNKKNTDVGTGTVQPEVPSFFEKLKFW